jgi:hypothetical protein
MAFRTRGYFFSMRMPAKAYRIEVSGIIGQQNPGQCAHHDRGERRNLHQGEADDHQKRQKEDR